MANFIMNRKLVDVLHKYKNFVFDMDGVLWRGNDPMPEAVEAHAKMVEAGKNIFYLTNNSTRKTKTIHKKLTSLQFTSNSSHIYNANVAASIALKNKSLRKVFYFGSA